MTDEELKALVASLAIAQRITDEQQRKTDEQLRKTDEQMRELQRKTDEQLRKTDEQMRELQRKTDEQLRKTAEEVSKTDEQLRKTAEEVSKTAEKVSKTAEEVTRTNETLKSVGIQLGNMGKNQGCVAEEFFFNSLLEDTHLGSIHFDDITKSEFKHRGKIQEEYDILMTNAESVGVVEVKYNLHEKDLDKLERKMNNFKKLYPLYANYKLYGAVASFHVHSAVKKAALDRGFFVLQRLGNVIHTDASENLLVL